MIINYLGLTAFRLQINGVSILLDPYKDSSGLKLPRMQNDIVLFTHNKQAEDKKTSSFEIDTPGEFEIKEIFIYGIQANGQTGGDKIIYVLEAEEMRLAHLGVLTQPKLNQSQLEKLEGVDVLFVPVGGGSSLDAKQASDIIKQLEPRVVIAMNYKQPKVKEKLEALEVFKKEIGVEFETVDKLKLVRKDLPEEDTIFYEIKATS